MAARFQAPTNIILAAGFGVALLAACQAAPSVNAQAAGPEAKAGSNVQITADVWVDNWFSLHVNGEKVLEDSTPFNTERSFNSDSGTFTVTLPATVALELRDFYENDTGLEYIGNRRQQLGDGGAIAQFTDAAGKTRLVTDESWRCKAIHRAPLNRACRNEQNPRIGQGTCTADISAAPDRWTQPGFDDSGWSSPSLYSAKDVQPKQGYDSISWDRSAKFIWGSDLEVDNVVLCRATLS